MLVGLESMSAITSIGIGYYTNMANNAVSSMMNANQARLSMIQSASCYPSFGSLNSLAAMDTQLEMQAYTNSVQYQIANAMLKSLKKLQKENIERSFNIFA